MRNRDHYKRSIALVAAFTSCVGGCAAPLPQGSPDLSRADILDSFEFDPPDIFVSRYAGAYLTLSQEDREFALQGLAPLDPQEEDKGKIEKYFKKLFQFDQDQINQIRESIREIANHPDGMALIKEAIEQSSGKIYFIQGEADTHNIAFAGIPFGQSDDSKTLQIGANVISINPYYLTQEITVGHVCSNGEFRMVGLAEVLAHEMYHVASGHTTDPSIDRDILLVREEETVKNTDKLISKMYSETLCPRTSYDNAIVTVTYEGPLPGI